jgi:hypothetical protein
MKKQLSLFALALAAWAQSAQPVEAAVNVYGETAASGPAIVVNIYADSPSKSLLSFGVRLLYDTNTVYVLGAAKNTAVWHFSTGGTNIPYIDPDTATPGQVSILGAKFDSLNPLEGVFGQHILLGTVTFGLLSQATPHFTLALGRPAAFSNFVATDGAVLDTASDGVVFNPITPVQVSGVSLVAGGVSIKWLGGQATQVLQRRYSLAPRDPWLDVFTNLPSAFTNIAYVDPISTNRAAFYRIRMPY